MDKEQAYETFVANPKATYLRDSIHESLDRSTVSTTRPPQHAVIAEMLWAQDNPKGYVERLDEDHIVLWNFNVASALLKLGHLQGPDMLMPHWRVVELTGTATIQVDGHASSSGAPGENLVLSRERAAAVFLYLLSLGVKKERIRMDYHGASKPWSPNLTGESMARNRRVEVRIVRPPESSQPIVVPIKPPEELTETPIWRTVSTPKLGDLVPGFSFEGKIPAKWPPIPIGDVLILHPKAEFSIKLELKTQNATAIAVDLKEGKFNAKLKVELNKHFQIQGSTEGKVGVVFHNTPLKPEVEWDFGDPLAPVSINCASPVLPIPKVKITEGVTVNLEASVKVKIGVGPGPAILRAIARTGGAGMFVTGAVVGIAGGVAITYGVARLVEGAREQGMERARQIARRDAYAWRVADEATGLSRDKYAREKLEEYRPLQLGGVFRAAYDGWMFADSEFERMPSDKRTALRVELIKRFGAEIHTCQRNIFYSVGGVDYDEMRMPPSPERLIYK